VKGWPGRLARGALLAAAAGLLFTAAYDFYARRVLLNPSDAALAARFRAHRGEFEELLNIERAHLGMAGPARRPGAGSSVLPDLARLDLRRRELGRSLGLDGGRRRATDSLVSFRVSSWFPRARFDDVKGYAYSIAPAANQVEDLDAVAAPPRRRGQVLRWHRPLEGSWYLYREVGGSAAR
jgi:hypothetical protein